MRRPTLALIAALLAALALPACGSADDTTGARANVPNSESSAARPNSDVALKRIGSFDSPVDVAAAPGYPNLLFVVEQEGKGACHTGERSCFHRAFG